MYVVVSSLSGVGEVDATHVKRLTTRSLRGASPRG